MWRLWRAALASKDWSVGRAGPSPSPSPLFVLFSWDGREEPGPPAAASGASSGARGEWDQGGSPFNCRERRLISGVHPPPRRSASSFPCADAKWLYEVLGRVGARSHSRPKAPPQGSFPDCGKPFGARGAWGFLSDPGGSSSSLPPLFLLPPFLPCCQVP